MELLSLIDITPLQWKSVLVAMVCGGMIGMERQLAGKPAGVRTSMLICLGTYVFVAVANSLHSAQIDYSRVIGQIITGIGFLGAGVMLTREGIVIGVTSAAVIWMLAAIGCLIGLGYHSAPIAISFVVLLILLGVNLAEYLFRKDLKKGVHEK